MWKEKVTYGGIHSYIKWHLPKPELCQMCNKVPPYDRANISGKYLRDPSDWQWLCRSCHMISDGRMVRIHIKIPKDLEQIRQYLEQGCMYCDNLKIKAHGWSKSKQGSRRKIYCHKCNKSWVAGPVIQR